MKNQKLLAAAIGALLGTASLLGGYQALAADMTDVDFDKQIVNGSYDGQGEDITLTPASEENRTGVIQADGRKEDIKSTTISNIGKLEIVTADTSAFAAANRYNGVIEAAYGGIVNIQNVNQIILGTAETPINNGADNPNGGGPAIHGLSGTVQLGSTDNRIGTLSIHTTGNAIFSQQSNGDAAGKVDVYAQNIDIISSSKNTAIASAILGGKQGGSTLTLDAENTISIINTGDGTVIQNYDQNKEPDWHGTGTAQVNIHGGSGVILQAANHVAVYAGAQNNSGTSTNISSDKDVVISGTRAVYFNNTGTSDMTANITGGNVTLTATGEGANAITANSADVTIGGTSANSQIQVNGNIAVVSNDQSKASAVTFSNGNVDLKGKIAVKNNSTVTFDENTNTYVDAKYLTDGSPFITAAGDGKVAIDGKMTIQNIKTGDTLEFTNNAAAIEGKENVKTTNALQNAVIDEKGKLTIGTVSAEQAQKELAGAVLVNTALAATASNHDSVTALFNGKSAEERVQNLNRVANFGELGGLSHSAYSVSNLFTDAVSAHYADVPENEKAIWANYIHNEETVDGIGLGGMRGSYDATYDGAVVGADLYHKDGKTAGVAVSYVNGSIEGITKNDADYYGISLYGRSEKASYTLLGDVTWLHGSNDLTQYTAGQRITASPDIDAFSVGVKALKDIDAGVGTVTPYIGARYMRIAPESYTASNGLHYDAESQDLFLLPVGVDYSVSLRRGAWTYRPVVGVGYLWTAGDRNADQTVSLGSGADTFGFDTADSGSFLAKVGVTAEKENLSFGVRYEYQDGDTVQADKWIVNAAFKF